MKSWGSRIWMIFTMIRLLIGIIIGVVFAEPITETLHKFGISGFVDEIPKEIEQQYRRWEYNQEEDIQGSETGNQ